MMDTTSNELSRKGTSSDGDSTFSSACAENVHSPGWSCDLSGGEKRKRNEYGESYNTGNGGVVLDNRRGSNDNGVAERRDESVQPKISQSSGAVFDGFNMPNTKKFNDFDKLREEVNFEVGQTWALYDTATDGMPRLYAQIRKVSAPSFGLRITYLEPDPDDEKEVLWFEEDLPVSVGKFRLGKNQNTTDRSVFSHLIQCNEGSSTGHFTVFPRKGETWALFKNWDINWSSEPNSHRKYEYEFVEVLSDYADGAGVSVVFLHKAKGFARVFFRLGTGDADISQILPHSLYRLSHRIPSFKMTGVEARGLPNGAYELDQAALPDTIEEKTVPFHLLAPKPKPVALNFSREGKVFQTGQVWSFYSGKVNLPLYYCRIQKITLIQEFEQGAVFKLHVNRFKATPSPENVIQWVDKNMPVGCGTFLVMKNFVVLTPDNVSHQILPHTSMSVSEYTILPKIGQVWAVYRSWTHLINVNDLEKNDLDYDIVEVLDDAFDYKVLALEAVFIDNGDEEKKTVFRAAESRQPGCDDEDGSEVVFTIPKSKMLRFSHQIPATRITKEIQGALNELFEVDCRALPENVKL